MADDFTPENGDVPDQIGSAQQDPAQIVAKALLCFNDKYVSQKSIFIILNWSFKMLENSSFVFGYLHIWENCFRSTAAVKSRTD